MGIAHEFREFAVRGNMVDMAVGIVVGAAFGRVVTSLVNDVLMPPIGLLLGGVDFSALAVTLKQATADTEAVTLGYGAFVNTLIDFLIIALAIFVVVKGINSLRRQEAEAPAEPAAPTREEVLLTEIRDALRTRSS